MKVLITGIAGFVGRYLEQTLSELSCEVYGIAHHRSDSNEHIFVGDITDQLFVAQTIEKIMPDTIFHLAGFSSVKKSFEDPYLTSLVNVQGTQNLLTAVEKFVPESRLLIVSSAEVYGNASQIPIPEIAPLQARSPYAESRINQENLVKKYPHLAIVIARSFNHTGPRQTDTFVIPSFCKQIVMMEKNLSEPILSVGDLSVVRDFSDVRDVVAAYILLVQKGVVGEIYNVGSGVGYKLSDLLNYIVSQSQVQVTIQADLNRMRPADVPVLIADIQKLQKLENWRPQYTIYQTIDAIMNHYRLTIYS